MERCKICGIPLQPRVESDAMTGKKVVFDCPRCYPERFGLPKREKGEFLADAPV